MTADEARQIHKSITEPRPEKVREAVVAIEIEIQRRAGLGWWKALYPLPDHLATALRPQELAAVEKSLRANGFHIRASQEEILEVSW